MHPRILSLSELHWKSGYDYLLQSYRLLKAGNIPFQAYISASGPLMNELLFSIDDLGLKDCVCISENEPKNYPDVFAGADIVVMPDLVENTHSIEWLQKAIVGNLPIVSTQFQGHDRIIMPGVKTFLVPLRDPVALAEAIERSINFVRQPVR